MLAHHRWKEGIAALERAVEIDSTAAGAWALLGQARKESGQQELAIRAYRRFLELHPAENPQTWQVRERLDSLRQSAVPE
jgi:cytochrome c-type biogenesis protein CcmH/NrfG